jgi:internalin A
MSAITNTKYMLTTKLARFATMCVGCAIVVTNIDPSFAQSTDRQSSRSDNPKSFAQWCQEKASVSPSRRLTIDVLLKEAGTNDCNIAERKLKSIRNLYLASKKISDLDPLASLTNLETLQLHNNQIVDINPLAGLTNLKILYLSINKIVKIDPLASLTNLKDLALYNNQIIDIKSLAGLTDLNTLVLMNNKIVDIKPLASLTNLETIDIQGNKVFDLKPLTGLSKLKHVSGSIPLFD